MRRKIFLWLARIISTTAALFFLSFVIGEIFFSQGPPSFSLEGLGVFVFFSFAAFGTFFTLKDRKKGLPWLILSGVALAVFVLITAGRNKILASVIISGPFLLSALFYHLSGRIKKEGG